MTLLDQIIAYGLVSIGLTLTAIGIARWCWPRVAQMRVIDPEDDIHGDVPHVGER